MAAATLDMQPAHQAAVRSLRFRKVLRCCRKILPCSQFSCLFSNAILGEDMTIELSGGNEFKMSNELLNSLDRGRQRPFKRI